MSSVGDSTERYGKSTPQLGAVLKQSGETGNRMMWLSRCATLFALTEKTGDE